MKNTINWNLVTKVATDLGAGECAQRKWKQRGVPPKWQIEISQELMARGIPVAMVEFDDLGLTISNKQE